MHRRIWALVAIATLLVIVTVCGARENRAPVNSPVPTKTLRPTFTATVPPPTVAPTATPEPATAVPTEQPAPTAEPASPTPEPSPTPEAAAAAFTVTSASLNVRSGPGTNFAVIGRLTSGQSFPITGKNAQGNWWEFDYNGRKGWVVGSNVSVRAADQVPVAQNIPVAPTAAPRPTARPVTPRPAQPTQPPAAPQPNVRYALTGKAQLRPNSNNFVTVWCFVINRGGNGLNSGTIRVLREGAVVQEKAFNGIMSRGDAGYSSEFLYNDGCKVEIAPAANGNYSAYLIDGGAQISDVYNFAVSGEANRIAIIEWKER